LITTVSVMAALAVPALGLRTANPSDVSDLPSSVAVVHAERAIQLAFPGTPSPAELVVTGRQLGTTVARRQLLALGERARAALAGRGEVGVTVAADGDTALLTVPMAAASEQAQDAAVNLLRAHVAPLAARIGPGARMLVGGDAAESEDFTARMDSATPRVLVFVLGLAFLLLVVTFGSPWLAAAVIALNLLSVAAAYGVLASVFQGSWAEHLLHFSSDGSVASWLPLFLFVVLFGLSMDYTVLVLERIREARGEGMSARDAAAEGIAATGGTVTSAAIIMVAVFSIFASLHVLELKQMGVGLAAAVLLDATIIRGVALPAMVSLRRLAPRRGSVTAQEAALS
jgi:RND superfamily putative drug exporter